MKKIIPLTIATLTLCGLTYGIDRPAPKNTPSPGIKVPNNQNEKPDLPTPPQPEAQVESDQAQAPTQPQAPIPQSTPKVWLGLVPTVVPPELLAQLELNGNSGVLVRSVGPNSPAQKAGIKEYDILLKVKDAPIHKIEDIGKILESCKPGEEVTLDIIRATKPQQLKSTLEAIPDNITHADGVYNEPQSSPLSRKGGNLTDDFRQRILPQLQSQGSQLKQRAHQLKSTFKNQAQDSAAEALDMLMNDFFESGPEEMEAHIKKVQALMGNIDQAMDALKQPLPTPPPGVGIQSSGNVSFQFNVNDGQGSIGLKKNNGKTTVTARDKNGKVIFEGPYDTAEEKAAVPTEVRERLDGLSIVTE